ncbi:MAG: hypothetical protein HYV08_16950 [Deltaproteobacteria bacterium]|nr:hypothetical protein [Deltaproteobacteria bacterium]MBI3078133.1 hypothetical protein [Deltaproteobacteria bacterium]
MEAVRSVRALKPFFERYTRRTFAELAIGGEEIVDYVAELLARFSRSEALPGPAGRREREPLHSVVEMLVAAQEGLGEGEAAAVDRQRDLHQHVADYCLFMSGVFREYATARSFLGLYLTEGQRAYHEVFEFDQSRYRPGAQIFRELAEQFESYSGALDYMKKVYFHPDLYQRLYYRVLREIYGL